MIAVSNHGASENGQSARLACDVLWASTFRFVIRY